MIKCNNCGYNNKDRNVRCDNCGSLIVDIDNPQKGGYNDTYHQNNYQQDNKQQVNQENQFTQDNQFTSDTQNMGQQNQFAWDSQSMAQEDHFGQDNQIMSQQSQPDEEVLTPVKFAKKFMYVLVMMPIVFFIQFSRRDLDPSLLFSLSLDGQSVKLIAMFVFLGVVVLYFGLWGVAVYLRADVFNKSERYPMNDYFLKKYKLHKMGKKYKLPDSVGFFEVMLNSSVFDVYTIALAVPLVICYLVWNNPVKLALLTMIAIISIIISVSLKVFPDKINKYFKNDIRSEEGYRTYYKISLIPVLLLVPVVLIHII